VRLPATGGVFYSMGTCHKCAAALGRGTQKHAQCPTCGLLYHVTDCGGRYAACPDLNVPLDACPKVRRRSIFIFDFDLDFWTFDLPHPNFPEVQTLIARFEKLDKPRPHSL